MNRCKSRHVEPATDGRQRSSSGHGQVVLFEGRVREIGTVLLQAPQLGEGRNRNFGILVKCPDASLVFFVLSSLDDQFESQCFGRSYIQPKLQFPTLSLEVF